MLQKVTGQNFQGLKDVELSFSPGVNVIIGKSDTGKSAIFRLIEWVRTNRPLGDAFRSEWGGTTKGKIWTTDNRTIERVKGDKENSYQINDNQKMKAFGQNPPDEVFQALMLDEINVQSQDDPPFLLSNSAGEVARVLNQAASLQEIDTVTSNLTKGYRKALREIESTTDILFEQKKELKQYDNLPTLEEAIIELEHLANHRKVLVQQRNTLHNLSQDIIRVRGRLENIVDVRPISGLLGEIGKLNGERNKLSTEFHQLDSLKRSLDQARESIKLVDGEIETSQMEYLELMPNECPLCGGTMK